VYYGTDSRLAEICTGGLLALAYPRLKALTALHRWRIPDIAGFAGLLAGVVIFLGVPQQRPAVYGGGLAAFSIVSAMMIVGSVEGPVFRRVLGWRPLAALGKISYGVYLFHFPIYIFLSEKRVGFGGMALLALRLVVSVGLAAASYRWYELPIRRGVALKNRMAPIALVAGAAAVLLVAMPVSRIGLDEQRLVFRPVPTATSTTSTSTSTTLAGTAPSSTASTVTTSTLPTTTTTPPRPPRVVVVGDSTAAANGAGLKKWGEATGRIQVVTVSEPGCGIVPGKQFTIREGYTFEPHRCDQLFPKAAAAARDLDADAIIVFIGSSQLADWEYSDLQGLHRLGEPVIDTRYSQAIDRVIGELSIAGRPILWATVPLPMWDLEEFGKITGTHPPGEGPITLNDPARTIRINELNNSGVPGHALATLFPYAAKLTLPDGTVPKRIRPDGVHLSDDGVAEIADEWLFDTLGKAVQTILGRAPAGLNPPERETWNP
jgi:hypothetical protein